VPWGELQLPALPDVTFILGTDDSGSGPVFRLVARGPRRRKAAIYGVFALVREELVNNSLYRGKAVDGEMNFLNLDAVDASKVIYSTTAYEALRANIWTPIVHADTLRELGLPSKRAALLHGDWGTGKTLAAYLTAQIAVRHGWTFLRARPGVDDLNSVMAIAKLYAPAVVFFEDIDVISDPDRLEADEASKLLDSFDGMTAKGQEVLAVMTTNHIERIHKGMVRPGRLDAVIELGALDQPRTLDLLLTTIPSHLVDADDVMANEADVAEAHEGYTPAFVVESAGRAMRYAVARSENGDTPKITGQDLVHSGNGLRNQLELMQGARSDLADTNIDNLLTTRVKDVTTMALEPIYERFDLEAPR
jgi:transitional endoplasmic reticulum ATPase